MRVIYLLVLIAFLFIYLKPELNSFILPERQWLDKNHFFISGLALTFGIYTCLAMRKAGHHPSWLYRAQNTVIWIAVVCGMIMMIGFEGIKPIVNVAYTLFDVGIVMGLIFSLIWFVGFGKSGLFRQTTKSEGT